MQVTNVLLSRRGFTTTVLLVLAIGVAIWAQRYLTDLSVPLDGKIGYIVAALLFVIALARNPFHVLRDGPRADSVKRQISLLTPRWRRLALLGSGMTFVLAYGFFGINPRCATTLDYCFTRLNVTLWVLTLGLFLAATWDWNTTDATSIWQKIRGFKLTAGWTGFALLGIMVVAAWFLFYRLASVPAETTSDHAEKLYDVIDILNGNTPIFMSRNTGREPLYFYWIAWLVKTFNLTTDHLALKVSGSILSLITIPFVFMLGREVGGTGVGLLTAYFTAISKWYVAITRVGLRVPASPLLATPAMLYTFRALRLNRRNDWLLAGLFIGFGLMTYTPSRMIPLLTVLLIGLRLAWDVARMPGGLGAAWRHVQANLVWRRGDQTQATTTEGPTIEPWEKVVVPPTLTRPFWVNVGLMIIASVLAFLPLVRFSIERSELFWFRSLTRAATLETGQAFNPLARFLGNLWSAALQFNYRGDNVWVNTVMWDPQLDPVSGALFVLGILYSVLAIIGLIRITDKRKFGVFGERRFVAAALLISLLMLLMPSILALAFPIENPSVFRAANAPPVVMIFVAVPLVLVARQLRQSLGAWGTGAAAILIAAVLIAATVMNHRTYFDTYDFQLRRSAQNASEMAEVLGGFTQGIGDINHAWMVAYPNWVDTRNVFLAMGYGQRNNYLPAEQGANAAQAHVGDPAPKMYILAPQDQNNLRTLQTLFPNGQTSTYQSRTPGKDFVIFFVPGAQNPR